MAHTAERYNPRHRMSRNAQRGRWVRDLCLDTIRAQQDLDVFECGACQVPVHHRLVHLLHQLQVQHMKVGLLHVMHCVQLAKHVTHACTQIEWKKGASKEYTDDIKSKEAARHTLRT